MQRSVVLIIVSLCLVFSQCLLLLDARLHVHVFYACVMTTSL